MEKIDVTLTDYELAQASQVGCLRFIADVRRKKKPSANPNEWQIHIEGACGEMAAAKATGKYWGGTVNTFKSGGDIVSDYWEVRTRSSHDYDLIIRDDDPDDRLYILVTGQAPTYSVRGWMWGRDAKKTAWRKNYGNYQAAFFVPQSYLKDLEDLNDGL